MVRFARAMCLTSALLAACSSSKGGVAPRDGQADAPRDAQADAPRDANDGGPGEAPLADADALPTADRDAVAEVAADTAAPSADADAQATDLAPAPNALCAAPVVLDATTARVQGALLDQGGPAAAACDGAGAHALFYAVDVPAGQRLIVTARATAGAAWTPRLAAFLRCDATACLARGTSTAGANQRLDWINNGASAQHVILSVSADVAGAEVDVAVGLVDLFASCASPVPVKDGSTFVNLDLTGVAPSKNLSCFLQSEPAFYYVATVLPQQHLTVSALRNGAPVGAAIGLRNACDDGCAETSSEGNVINQSTTPKTVLIEVTRTMGPFDLHFSLPLPPPGVLVTPTSALTTTESGGKATFEVKLTTQPTANVSIDLSSSRPAEGTPSPAKLVFDATNWHLPQKVTVTGVDDQASDGAQKYAIVTAPAVSADAQYSGFDADDVPLTNMDDDAGIVVAGAEELVTSEDGTTAKFTVRLGVAPTANVDVPLASADAGEGTASPASLRFTPANWNVAQTVTITGADDAIKDGTQHYTIGVGPLVSDDARYGGLTPAGIPAHNRDNDFTEGTKSVALGGDLCEISNTPNQYPAAIDAMGTLYAVVKCQNQLQLLTSSDGGTTISGPTPIPGATNPSGGFAIAAGRGGAVYVAISQPGTGLQLLRSKDGGATWRERNLSTNLPALLRIAAVRDNVVIAGDNARPDGSFSGTLVLRSDDGGLSFLPDQIIEDVVGMQAMNLYPDGRTLRLVSDQPALYISSDPATPPQQVAELACAAASCVYVFSETELFALELGAVNVTDLFDPTNTETLTGTGSLPIAGAADDLNVVTIVGLGATAASDNLVTTRMGADRKLGAPKDGGTRPLGAGSFVLSRHATSLVSFRGNNRLSFTIERWP